MTDDGPMLHAVVQHYAGVALGAPRDLWPAGVPKTEPTLVPLRLRPNAFQFKQAVLARQPARVARLFAKGIMLTLPTRIAGEDWRSVDGTSTLLDCPGVGYGNDWSLRRMLALRPLSRAAASGRAHRHVAAGLHARDRDSVEHLRRLARPAEVELDQCPDITHALAGRVPPDGGSWRRRICIVPNTRMIDRTSPDLSKVYVDFIVDAVADTAAVGFEPWLVVHEINDDGLAETIVRRAGSAMRCRSWTRMR